MFLCKVFQQIIEITRLCTNGIITNTLINLLRIESIADLESTAGKRLITVSKRFRDSGNTDTELKKIEAKKRRSEKKEVKVNQAKAQEVNTQYLIDNLEKQSTKKVFLLVFIYPYDTSRPQFCLLLTN